MKLVYESSVRRFDVFEAVLTDEAVYPGEYPPDINPFTDRPLTATFRGPEGEVRVDGFYDGGGVYKVRFMPSYEGDYTFRVDVPFEAAGYEGAFHASCASKENHGPVRVAGTFHFAYEDGTPYQCLGTTCYVFELQTDDMIEETYRSLEEAGFNKIRFCLFPKHYAFNLGEPRSYPYQGTPMDSSVLTEENFMRYHGKAEGNHFNLKRFNPLHFQHIEKVIRELGKRGIEADLIMMHPYDRWGFSMMSPEEDDLYWNYAVARFAAFHNVWWAFANEYDLMKSKTTEDWERFARIVLRKDPYHHLRSIHNCMAFYDHSRPWITHCSIQQQDLYKGAELVDEWRQRYQKPVVMDEMAYEGDIPYGWGNISGEEMIRRFWECALRGGYPGHGETYLHPSGKLWWSHGGKLRGESWKRVKFLKKVMEEGPSCGLTLYDRRSFDETVAVPDDPFSRMSAVKSYYLFYYSFMRPSYRDFYFDDETRFHVEVLDTWNGTIEDRGIQKGRFRVTLPARPYMAVRIQKV